MSKIIIADYKTDEVLDHIIQNDVIDNAHEQDMSTWVETFEFETFANKDYAKHLTDRNLLLIPAEEGGFRELFIVNATRYSTTNGAKLIDITAYGFYQKLATAKIIDPGRTPSQAAEPHMRDILASTNVRVGKVAYTGNRTITRENKTDPFAALKSLANEFDLELNFRVEIENGKVVRYADLLDRIGEWRGRTVEFGRDLQTISRKSDSSNIVTALLVLGPRREDGSRIEEFVPDEDARKRWSEDGSHIVRTYEPQTENTEITRERLHTLGRTELNKRINAIVSWEINITDLEHVPGMSGMKIRYGDTIFVKDTGFNPPFYVEARIFKQRRNIFSPGSKQVTLGDFREFTIQEVRDNWEQLREELEKKIGWLDLRIGAAVIEGSLRIIEKDKLTVDSRYAEISVHPNLPTAIFNSLADAKANYDVSYTTLHDYLSAENEDFEYLYEIYSNDLAQINHIFDLALDEIALDRDDRIREELDRAQQEIDDARDRLDESNDRLDEADERLGEAEQDIEDFRQDLIDYDNRKVDSEHFTNIIDDLNADLADKVDFEYVDGQLRLKADSDLVNSINDSVGDLLDDVTAIHTDLQNKVDSNIYNQKISDIESDIAEKVDGEWVDGRLATKADADTVYTIEEVENRFTNYVGVTEYQTDKDGYVQRFESAESRISQTETDIESTVTKTEFEALEDDVGKHGQRLSTNETNISQNAEAITQRVTQTDFNSFTGEYESMESLFTQTAQLIEGRISKEEYNQFTGEYTSLESLVTQQDGKINSRVSKQQYETDEQNYITRFADYESNVTQTWNEINARVKQTVWDDEKDILEQSISNVSQKADRIELSVESVQADFDNLEIGGRNLLRNTDFKGEIGAPSPNGWGANRQGSNPDISELVESPWTSGGRAFHIKVDNARYYLSQYQRVPVEAGEEITVSVKTDSSDLTVWWEFYDSEGSRVSFRALQRFTEGIRHYFTLTVPEGATQFLLSRIGIGTSGTDSGEAVFERIKLEKGNKATDWTPAPEDIDNQIGAVSTQLSELSVTVDGISGDVSRVETTVDEHGETLISHNARIEANAESITQRVSKTEYESDQQGYITRFSDYETWRTQTNTSINDRVTQTEYDAETQRLDTYISEVEQTAEGIEQTVGQVRQDLDDLEFGGRNYFSLNEFQDLSPTSWVVTAYVYYFELEPNTEYTVSSNVPGRAGTSDTNIYFNGSGTSESGVWEGRPITKKSDDNGELYVAVPTGRPHTNDLINGVYWIQLEKGNVATDYSPAPEDTQEFVYTQIQQLSDSISLEYVKDDELIAGIRIGDSEKIDGAHIIITGDTDFTGRIRAPEAVFIDMVTEDMTAKRATIETATITGDITADEATFIEGTFENITAIDANIENATITGDFTAGNISGVDISGSTITSRNPGIALTETVIQGGNITSRNLSTGAEMTVRNGNISGGSITSNTTIDVSTDIRIGNLIEMGSRESEVFFRREWAGPGAPDYIMQIGTPVRAEVVNIVGSYRPIMASSFPTGSSEQFKSDIEKYEESALNILRSSVIYEYKKDGVPNRELGFIIEREFPDIIKHDDISVNGYSHSSLNTKAIQELDNNLNSLERTMTEEINWLKTENQYLHNEIKKLKEKVA